MRLKVMPGKMKLVCPLYVFMLVFNLSYAKQESSSDIFSGNELFIPKIDFYVNEVNSIVEGETRNITFGVVWEMTTSNRDTSEFVINIFSSHPKILEVLESEPICIQQGLGNHNFTFSVKGVFLGFAKINIKLRRAPFGCLSPSTASDKNGTKDFEISASVIRYPSKLVDAVTGIMAALVAFNYINMGVQLDLHCIGKVLKKPIGPIIGFICQFLFMPLGSYGISYLLLDDISLRLGLFTLGCSPGGSMSNFWTLLFNGDVNLSITMTFISTVAALAMMPLWIFTLGKSLFRSREATIPYINIAGSLIILTIPIGVGLLIQQYSPRLTKLSKKIIKPITLICVLFGIFVGLYANQFVFQLFTWQVVLAGIGIAWGGYCFGALMAWIFRLNRSQIIAVSIETAFQNPAVAFVMLLMSLPQPEADLTAVPVICQLILTGTPMWALLVVTTVFKKLRKPKNKETDKEMIENPTEYAPVSAFPPMENVGIDNNNKSKLITSTGKKVAIVSVTNHS